MSREKQLQGIDRRKVVAKVARGESITLKELAVYCGQSYSPVRAWQDQGLPLLSGKIFIEDFVIWRRRKMGLELPPAFVVRPRGRAAGRSGELLSRHD
jgi:hypothetical protein